MFEPKGWGYLQNYEHMVQPIIAKVDTGQGSKEYPLHTHPKGQLILALDGYVTCEAANKMWMVPTHSAIWVPANTCHSNRASDNANLCFVFIDANLKGMPTHTCTLAITSLVKSLMLKLASENQAYSEGDKTARLAQVLFDLLIEMPAQPLDFALSKHVVIQTMSRELIEHPNNRKTLAQWAVQFALTERTLARLIKKQTGMTFGKWRTQLHIITALQALSDGQSVQQVSELLGYESVSAFITMFKKVMGKSPTKYLGDLN
ncbi:helix-turn-helix transcriptional regulator [Pseudoalteromonas carrageenovora]|uniref:AraC family transcriptional regulator n=1 Tax=Pseudoalteromonas carrageenovora TaxID=227 RepID=UPI0026E1EFF6|nr:helix-turn-helix transcriptional regulator [Pseudoalteromonas carrageenovora]MDO6837137.1 helix-turn-helix transcriptional regulator [Pseudoalteromonas carrageenovora]